MQRLVYHCLLLLALPFVPLKLLWRGIKQPSYLKHWAERFGFYQQTPQRPIISIHCVSVGETRAAAPLIKALLAQHPGHQVLITHGTPTGRETSEALFGQQVLRAYLPYDLPFAVKRFLKHFKPALVILMETEIWFNLIAQCQRQHVPTLLINARLSAKSAAGYAKVGQLMREGLGQLSAVHTQAQADAERFAQFGITPQVSGNLKFDVQAPATHQQAGSALKQQLTGRKVFVAASTRDGEEALIMKAVQSLDLPNLMTIIVPRHPQRFDEVGSLLTAQGIDYVRKSELSATQTINQPWMLGDTMGELATFYAAADVAFVGELLPLGGQNMIEPAAMGTPVIIGPHTFNFELVANQLVAAEAAIRVQDTQDLTQTLAVLLAESTTAEEQRKHMQQAGKSFVASHQGATQLYLNAIKPYITPTQD